MASQNLDNLGAGSDMLPDWRHVISWNSVEVYVSEFWIEIQIKYCRKMR